jgi:peptide/nickel transport system ATP-binding protein/oligopeptide transport system ATP-binding protein
MSTGNNKTLPAFEGGPGGVYSARTKAVDTPYLLEVQHLKVYFPVHGGLFSRVRGYIRAVDDVSFAVRPRTTVGLVGESGSGKTTIGQTLVRLIRPSSGSIRYQGKEISKMGKRAFFPYRKKMQMIFQDPFNSLNPRMSIEQILSEPLDIHFSSLGSGQKRKKVLKLLDLVGLGQNSLPRYPHEFSGGQRQRIGIARALAVEPEFIVCDEPVSALDVSVQATIINLLQDLQEELGLTYLFIAHDLAVVEHVSDEVLVMTQGRIVEQADSETIYRAPQHPYTKKLLKAVPKV